MFFRKEVFPMTKGEFVDALIERNPRDVKSRAAVNRMVDSMVDIITAQLVAGNIVALQGFGTFETVEHAERAGVNPSTGEKIIIPACIAPKFKASKRLKDAVAKK